jgi:hypothetical protein
VRIGECFVSSQLMTFSRSCLNGRHEYGLFAESQSSVAVSVDMTISEPRARTERLLVLFTIVNRMFQ